MEDVLRSDATEAQAESTAQTVAMWTADQDAAPSGKGGQMVKRALDGLTWETAMCMDTFVYVSKPLQELYSWRTTSLLDPADSIDYQADCVLCGVRQDFFAATLRQTRSTKWLADMTCYEEVEDRQRMADSMLEAVYNTCSDLVMRMFPQSMS